MKIYALKHSDLVRQISSSGGAFIAFADAFFRCTREQGRVYGVCFNNEMKLVYKCANNLEDCKKFCGSKYVNPQIGNIFVKIMKNLIDGIPVLFVGLPCHVYSLNIYLKKQKVETKNLYTIDLVCNGVPREQIWVDYVNYLEKLYHSQLVCFRFRAKGDPLNPYRTEIKFKDRKNIVDTNITASYNRLYLKKLIIRKSCFSCPFKKFERNGDITIGDFWGIDKISPAFNDGKGISIVLLSSEKGESIFKNIDERVIIQNFTEIDLNEYQENLRKKTKLPLRYEKFWNDYEEKGIEFVIKKYADGGYIGVIKHFCRHIYRKFK